MTRLAAAKIAAIVLVALCSINTAGGFARLPRSPSTRIANDTAGDCDVVRRFFEGNHTAIAASGDSTDGLSNTICGGRCCNKETEERLRHQAKVDFQSQIHHHSRSLLGLLATTADALRETVTTLARQSENKTLTLFKQVYRTMAVQSRPSIEALYQAMVDYVSPENTPDTLGQALTQEMLHEKFSEFFKQLFPIAYHRAVNPVQGQQDFTEKFKACLYRAMDEIQPFGDIPKQIAQSVGKSLEATRVLIQALTLGTTVLVKTDGVLFTETSQQQEACYKALLRMTHCPKCKGIGTAVAPCRGFCTNVMRGCLTEPASELDFAWSEYVETVERLVVAVDGHSDPLGLNAEKAVRHLDSRISDAVMHAMEKGPALEEKVRNVCGRPELQHAVTIPTTSDPEPVISNPASIVRTGFTLEERAYASPPIHPSSLLPSQKAPNHLHVQLGNFLASVVRSRTFYGTLADTICEEYPDRVCWNGERVGEYSKTVVDSSLTSQKYNPEFALLAAGPTVGNGAYGNPNASVLIDQLRHINQVVQSQLISAPDSGVLLSDEALEGSGSGDRPIWARHPNGPGGRGDPNDDDEDVGDDDDRDDSGEASGSGMGPAPIDPVSRNENSIENPISGSGSANVLMSSLLVLVLVVVQLAA